MLMAVAIGANADGYTADAKFLTAVDENLDTLIVGDYTWNTYDPLPTFDEHGARTVSVTSDSIIVSNWYGYGNTSIGYPYDLICYLDADGHITKYGAKVGDTLYPYYNFYVYTGPAYDNAEGKDYCVYFNPWTETYSMYTQFVSDATTKSGYLFLYGTAYGSGTVGYYFLSWGDYKFEVNKYVPTGITAVEADAISDAQSYNLLGQPVSSDAKGLVVKNGKKVLVK